MLQEYKWEEFELLEINIPGFDGYMFSVKMLMKKSFA